MMFNLYVLQNQWIVATLFAGGALTLAFWLTYSAMWRPLGLETKSEQGKEKGIRARLEACIGVVPWIIILIALACACYTAAVLVLRSCLPPNW